MAHRILSSIGGDVSYWAILQSIESFLERFLDKKPLIPMTELDRDRLRYLCDTIRQVAKSDFNSQNSVSANFAASISPSAIGQNLDFRDKLLSSQRFVEWTRVKNVYQEDALTALADSTEAFQRDHASGPMVKQDDIPRAEFELLRSVFSELAVEADVVVRYGGDTYFEHP
ncbi:hypothetical protein KKG66_03700 [bacterium]|nr:hypothetical protein [bacterium]